MEKRNSNSNRTRLPSVVRLLGIGITICVVFFGGRAVGWVASRKKVVAAQTELIQAVETLSGQYYYDYELQADGSLSKSAEPNWLAQWIGKNWLHDVFYVTVANVSPGDPNEQRVSNPTRVDDQFLDLMTDTNVKWLALNGSGVTDQGIQRIAKQIQLEKIWLSQTGVTDQAMLALTQCENLHEVAVESTRIGDTSVRHLASIPSLKTLSIGGNAITEKGLESLSTASQLQDLYLDGLPVTDRVISQLSTLKNLRKLSLRSTRVQHLVPTWLSEQSELLELRLDGTPLRPSSWQSARMPSSLRSISVSFTPLNKTFLQSLAGCEHLEHLSIRQTQIAFHEAMEFLQKELDKSLSDSLVTLGVAEPGSESISKVDLTGFSCTDDDLAILRELPNLQWLYIPGHRLSQDSLQSLGDLGNGKLNLLDISESSVTADLLRQLLSESQIVNLHIRRTSIPPAELQELKTEFSNCRIYATDFGEHQFLKRAN